MFRDSRCLARCMLSCQLPCGAPSYFSKWRAFQKEKYNKEKKTSDNPTSSPLYPIICYRSYYLICIHDSDMSLAAVTNIYSRITSGIIFHSLIKWRNNGVKFITQWCFFSFQSFEYSNNGKSSSGTKTITYYKNKKIDLLFRLE